MPFSIWQPGQTITAEALDLGDMIGALVFFAERTTNQAITTGGASSANAVSWDQVNLDLLDAHDSGDATKWTAPQDGWWIVSGGVGYTADATGSYREATWFVDGSLHAPGRGRPLITLASTLVTVAARTIPVQLSAGSYVELVAAHETGSNLNTATGSFRPFMSVTYAGPA